MPAVTALVIWAPSFHSSDMCVARRLEDRPADASRQSGVAHRRRARRLRGPLEWLLVGVVSGWVVLGVAQHRARLREAVDGRLLLGAALLGLFALVLPDSYMHHDPYPATLDALRGGAVPPCYARAAAALRRLLRIAVVGVAAVYVANDGTDVGSLRAQRARRAGCRPGAAAPEAARARPRLRAEERARAPAGPSCRPYAWAQVLKGGTLAFSFASFATSLVVFRSDVPPPWTGSSFVSPEPALHRSRSLRLCDRQRPFLRARESRRVGAARPRDQHRALAPISGRIGIVPADMRIRDIPGMKAPRAVRARD